MSKDRIVLVTQNKHKLAEITSLFNEYKISFDTTDLEKLEIRSQNVKSIAIAAAKHAYETLQRPVVVDDTGFFVEALNNFPGSYAAYVLQTIDCAGILRLLEGEKNRNAKFVTAVAFCDHNHLEVFLGEMTGTVSQKPSGKGGFGYDPIFIPEGYSQTYAELSFSEKVRISHRTRAFRAFLEWKTHIPDNP
ncbi:MAG: XTP/dITP diphosphatase [Candidatus Thorarchaeota archaeon]|nr:XTP/dITP diphosphatase [Candidatus Thorarchaeota archaeon]